MIDKKINSLVDNPIFHMSLGSRELFHSNFLAWLAKRDISVILDGLGLANFFPVNQKYKVKREAKNIDLLIEFGQQKPTHLLAIEVKVKDVLRGAQLKRYDAALSKICEDCDISSENIRKVALCLTEPNESISDWKIITFGQLFSQWERSGSCLQGDEEVIFKLYRMFIGDLSDLATQVTNAGNENFQSLTPFTSKVFPDPVIDDKLRNDLRLHSTFGKRLAIKLADDLLEQVQKKCKELQEVPVRADLNSYNDAPGIYVVAYGNFERGQAFASLLLNLVTDRRTSRGNNREVTSLGIMLQAGQYRRIISHPDFDFARGRASDEHRREQMYEQAQKVNCLEWLRSEGKEDLRGYAPQYIYTIEKYFPENWDCIVDHLIKDLKSAQLFLKKKQTQDDAQPRGGEN